MDVSWQNALSSARRRLTLDVVNTLQEGKGSIRGGKGRGSGTPGLAWFGEGVVHVMNIERARA